LNIPDRNMAVTISKNSKKAVASQKSDLKVSVHDLQDNVVIRKAVNAAEIFKKYPLPGK